MDAKELMKMLVLKLYVDGGKELDPDELQEQIEKLADEVLSTMEESEFEAA